MQGRIPAAASPLPCDIPVALQMRMTDGIPGGLHPFLVRRSFLFLFLFCFGSFAQIGARGGGERKAAHPRMQLTVCNYSERCSTERRCFMGAVRKRATGIRPWQTARDMSDGGGLTSGGALGLGRHASQDNPRVPSVIDNTVHNSLERIMP